MILKYHPLKLLQYVVISMVLYGHTRTEEHNGLCIFQPQLESHLQTAQKKISWNIDPIIWVPTNNTFQDEITIYVHGLGDRFNVPSEDHFINDLYCGPILFFKFQDAYNRYPLASYLGQGADIKALVWMLKSCAMTDGIKKINLIGYSRGGATILNTLCALACEDDDIYGSTELYPFTAQMIFSKIHAIVLICPLLHVASAVKSNTARTAKPKNKFITAVGWVTHTALLPLATGGKYNPFGYQPINSAYALGNKTKWKITIPSLYVLFQSRDRVVSTDYQSKLQKYLEPITNTLHVITGDGTHSNWSSSSWDELIKVYKAHECKACVEC